MEKPEGWRADSCNSIEPRLRSIATLIYIDLLTLKYMGLKYMAIISKNGMVRFVLLMVATIGAHAQQNPAPSHPPNDGVAQNDPIEALAGSWDHRCSDKGCVMFTDVLIGDPDHPSDPKHPEYITIGVAIDRIDRKPEYFVFDLPPDADRAQGVLIAFVKTVKDGKEWKMVRDTSGFSQLDFNECNADSCVARVHLQILGSDGAPRIDLLDKFLSMDQIYFIFTRKGVPFRAMKALFPFQRDYKKLMETELK